jgi:hypothetical protein
MLLLCACVLGFFLCRAEDGVSRLRSLAPGAKEAGFRERQERTSGPRGTAWKSLGGIMDNDRTPGNR